MLVAPVVAQLSVLLAPELMLVGFALKDVIAGTEPFPEDVFDVVPAAQPERAAKKARVSTSAHNSSTEGLCPRESSLFLQTEKGKSMRVPFAGKAVPVYRQWIRAAYWPQVQNRIPDARVVNAGSTHTEEDERNCG